MMMVAAMTPTSPPELFDFSALARNRNRAAPGFGDYDFLKKASTQRIVDRLSMVKRQFTQILDVGCHRGEMVQEILAQQLYPETPQFLQCDIADNFLSQAQEFSPTQHFDMKVLDTQQHQFDCVTSALFLHWVGDLVGLLTQIRLALKPDGLFVANMLGGRSLEQLRAALIEAETEITGGAYPRVIPMADIRDLGAVMQRAGFALPVVDAEVITVTYSNLFRLMADLRGMGEQNILHNRSMSMPPRRLFLRAAEIYQERFATQDNHIAASFELITLTGWSPAENQPKALRPGSAQMRLAQALETEEKDPLNAQIK